MQNKNERESNMREKGERPTTSKKVGGYVRVSTFEQAEKGTSIDEQKRIVREECLKRGWQLVQIYCDEGASGKLTDRQGLHDLQKDAYTGMFQTIMFTKSDRLTRSIRDLSNLWHDWTEAGIEIICVEQPEINSKGIYGKMLRNLLGIFAEWERDAIIERTTSGRMARWRKSEAFMGTLPYGYEFDRNNRKIVLHPNKARICKRIFNMYLHQKLSTREIALRLSEASIPSPRGKNHWQFTTILRILTNPAYAGRAELNMYKFQTSMSRNNQAYKRRSKEKKDRSQWISIEFPPIISKETHRRIHDRLKSSPSWLFKPGNKCYGKHFLLENISLVCGECGRKMSMRIVGKGTQPTTYYTYYRCRLNAMSRKQIATTYINPCRCDMRVEAQTLDNFIFGQIMELLSGIVSIVHRGVTELTLKRIMERAQIRPASLFMKEESRQTEHPECYRIAGWEVTKCSEIELEYIKNVCREYSDSSKVLKNKPPMRRCHQNDQLEIDYYRISSVQVIKQEPPDLSTDISHYVDRMTFEQKKRVIESIISPEYGGKCIIRWATPSDTSDEKGKLPSLPKGRFTSGAFRNVPQTVQITFFTDLSRVQSLVWVAGNDSISQSVEV